MDNKKLYEITFDFSAIGADKDEIKTSFQGEQTLFIWAENEAEARKAAEIKFNTANPDYYSLTLTKIYNETVNQASEFNSLVLLPAGETLTLEGKFGVSYEFLKNQKWDGEIYSRNNQVQIVAIYNGKVIASLDKDECLTSSYFNLGKILDGVEPMCGIYHNISCPIEEMKSMRRNFDHAPNDLFKGFLEMRDFLLEKASDADAPKANHGEEGEWYLQGDSVDIEKERYDTAFDIMNRLDRCFVECVLEDLEEEAGYYDNMNHHIDVSKAEKEDWTALFRKNDNLDCFNNNPHLYRFIQNHRFELELCEFYNEDKCKEVDLDKVYNSMHGIETRSHSKEINIER